MSDRVYRPIITRDGAHLAVHISGEGAPLLLLHGLGLSAAMWDAVMPHLPQGLQVIRPDLRGHGHSQVTAPPYGMGQLVSDAEDVLGALDIKDAAVVGLSLGGMIAQGLAVKRLDLVRVLVLSNTAAKIGSVDQWADRIDAVRLNGMKAVIDASEDRWFGQLPRHTHIRSQFLATDPQGFIGAASAIKGTDFYTPTSGLRLPTLGIAGTHDGSTPPDLVRETVDLIPGSQFHLMRRSGHLPCVDQPEAYAEILTEFLRKTGHI
ncbi:3-oxoadipate enol-lactonase [Nereida sp. MMG025]|uniref:3-oxoadipate enol-lactonase n=1 Tax=Nereida sp. MMG025 TaxID=2909981 RepID=UPI001F02B615|nr:3-oxoadipate enol-lactonase [Nereida sp. MMG025]MCF6445598.1 3-oxoadipate enol-lactonase [Nereida sp. MMG025]